MKSEIVCRRLNELDSFLGAEIKEGDYLFVSKERRKALQQNPYLEDGNAICEWVGLADGKPAGFNYSFPIRIWADGVSYGSTTGSCLNVQEWARKTDLGLILPAKGVEQTSKDGIAVAASCSQMAVPLHKVNGYRFFFSPRFIALWHSRSVVETILPSWLARPFAFLVDCAISVYALAVRMAVGFALRAYRVEEVGPDDASADEMARIVGLDQRRFREDHDAAWFKWHMTCSFSECGPCRGYLLRSKKDGLAVAFAMDKRRFYEKASHRGYRNVWLSSMVEWGADPRHMRLVKWLVACLALRSRRSCDAFEFATDDPALCKFARRILWRRVGDANVGVKVMKNFPLRGDKAITEQSNWRIRPGMGDNGLS